MKMKNLKIFWYKMGLMGWKESSLNVHGTENPSYCSIMQIIRGHSLLRGFVSECQTMRCDDIPFLHVVWSTSLVVNEKV